MSEVEILRVPDVTAGALTAVTASIRTAVALRGRAAFVLAGGSTPLPLYRSLAREDLPWERLHFFWGDERFVPLASHESNAGAAMAALLDLVPVPDGNIHTWPILSTPEASAAAYQGEVERTLGPSPTFDVTLLGLGDDAHTASLFPGTGDALRPEFAFATEAPVTSPVRDRLTLGAAALSRSRLVVFLVSGAAKQAALRATFGHAGPLLAPGAAATPADRHELDKHPARAIGALERLLVVTDLPE